MTEIDTVVFDKTGTLTLGRPELMATNSHPADILSLAARSRHPLAQALVRAAGNVSSATSVQETPGMGLEAVIDGHRLRLSAIGAGAASERQRMRQSQTKVRNSGLPALNLRRIAFDFAIACAAMPAPWSRN